MADRRFQDNPAASALTGAEIVPGTQGGVDVKMTTQEIADLASGGPVNADTHPASPNAADDEFEYGSSIDTTGARRSGATAWSAFNLSTGTAPVRGGMLALKPALNASRNWGGYTQPISGSWSYGIKISQARYSTSSLVGLFVATSSGASGNIINFGLNGPNLFVQRLTNGTTFSANSLTGTSLIPVFPTPALNTVPCYLRIDYNGTTLRFFLSASGDTDSYVEVHNQTSAAFLGTPAVIGIGGDNESSGVQCVAVVDWFRKLA